MKEITVSKDEMSVSLKDLLWHTFRHWRKVVVFALCGALLLGGFTFLLRWKTAKEATAITGDDMSDALVKAVELTDSYERCCLYNKNSLLMKIDANNIPTTTLSYLFTGKECRSAALLYQQYLTNEDFSRKVAEKLSTPDNEVTASLVQDIITTTLSVEKEAVIAPLDSLSMEVKIIAPDEEQCNSITATTLAYFDELQSTVAEKLSGYTCRLVGQSYAVLRDANLRNTKQANITSADTFLQDLNTAKGSLSKAETMYLEAYTLWLNDEESDKDNMELDFSVSPSVKTVVLGGFAGAFLVLVWYALAYLLSQKLKTPEDIGERYGVTVLTAFPVAEKKPAKLDTWLKRVFFTGLPVAERGAELTAQLLASRIQNPDFPQGTLLLCGCPLKEEEEAQITALTEALKEKGISVDRAGYPGTDIDAAKKLDSAGAVIMVEKTDESPLVDMDRTVEQCIHSGKPVVGAVVFR